MDTSATAASVTSSGAVALLTSTTQGLLDVANRIGDEIKLKGLIMRGSIAMGAGTISQDYTNVVRVIIFQWMPSTTPTVTDVLESARQDASYNHDKAANYRILCDERYAISALGPSVKIYEMGYSFKKAKLPFGITDSVKYNAGSSTATGHLYLLEISDSSAPDHPATTYYIRVSYIDP